MDQSLSVHELQSRLTAAVLSRKQRFAHYKEDEDGGWDKLAKFYSESYRNLVNQMRDFKSELISSRIAGFAQMRAHLAYSVQAMLLQITVAAIELLPNPNCLIDTGIKASKLAFEFEALIRELSAIAAEFCLYEYLQAVMTAFTELKPASFIKALRTLARNHAKGLPQTHRFYDFACFLEKSSAVFYVEDLLKDSVIDSEDELWKYVTLIREKVKEGRGAIAEPRPAFPVTIPTAASERVTIAAVVSTTQVSPRHHLAERALYTPPTPSTTTHVSHSPSPPPPPPAPPIQASTSTRQHPKMVEPWASQPASSYQGTTNAIIADIDECIKAIQRGDTTHPKEDIWQSLTKIRAALSQPTAPAHISSQEYKLPQDELDDLFKQMQNINEHDVKSGKRTMIELKFLKKLAEILCKYPIKSSPSGEESLAKSIIGNPNYDMLKLELDQDRFTFEWEHERSRGRFRSLLNPETTDFIDAMIPYLQRAMEFRCYNPVISFVLAFEHAASLGLFDDALIFWPSAEPTQLILPAEILNISEAVKKITEHRMSYLFLRAIREGNYKALRILALACHRFAFQQYGNINAELLPTHSQHALRGLLASSYCPWTANTAVEQFRVKRGSLPQDYRTPQSAFDLAARNQDHRLLTALCAIFGPGGRSKTTRIGTISFPSDNPANIIRKGTIAELALSAWRAVVDCGWIKGILTLKNLAPFKSKNSGQVEPLVFPVNKIHLSDHRVFKVDDALHVIASGSLSSIHKDYFSRAFQTLRQWAEVGKPLVLAPIQSFQEYLSDHNLRDPHILAYDSIVDKVDKPKYTKLIFNTALHFGNYTLAAHIVATNQWSNSEIDVLKEAMELVQRAKDAINATDNTALDICLQQLWFFLNTIVVLFNEPPNLLDVLFACIEGDWLDGAELLVYWCESLLYFRHTGSLHQWRERYPLRSAVPFQEKSRMEECKRKHERASKLLNRHPVMAYDLLLATFDGNVDNVLKWVTRMTGKKPNKSDATDQQAMRKFVDDALRSTEDHSQHKRLLNEFHAKIKDIQLEDLTAARPWQHQVHPFHFYPKKVSSTSVSDSQFVVTRTDSEEMEKTNNENDDSKYEIDDDEALLDFNLDDRSTDVESTPQKRKSIEREDDDDEQPSKRRKLSEVTTIPYSF